MKKRELTDYRNKTEKELEAAVAKLRTEIASARLDISMGKEKNTRKARNLKRDLTQILTIKTEILNQKKGENKE